MFQLLSQDSWTQITYWCMDAATGWAFIFFSSITIFGNVFLLNVATAVIMAFYSQTVNATVEHQTPPPPPEPPPPLLPHSPPLPLLAAVKPSRSPLSITDPSPLSHAVPAPKKLPTLVFKARALSRRTSLPPGVTKQVQALGARVRASAAWLHSQPWRGHATNLVVALRVTLLCMGYEGMSAAYERGLSGASAGLGALLALETLVALTALGPRNFLLERMRILEALLDVLFVLDYSLRPRRSGTAGLQAIRVLRLLPRGRNSSLRSFVLTLTRSLAELRDFGLLALLVLGFFMLLGMQLFGGRLVLPDGSALPPEQACFHFDNLGAASLTVFQVLVGDAWADAMHGAMRARGAVAALYYVVLLVVCRYVLLNLFMAILLYHFEVQRFVRQQQARLAAAARAIKDITSAGIDAARRMSHTIKRLGEMQGRRFTSRIPLARSRMGTSRSSKSVSGLPTLPDGTLPPPGVADRRSTRSLNNLARLRATQLSAAQLSRPPLLTSGMGTPRLPHAPMAIPGVVNLLGPGAGPPIPMRPAAVLPHPSPPPPVVEHAALSAPASTLSSPAASARRASSDRADAPPSNSLPPPRLTALRDMSYRCVRSPFFEAGLLALVFANSILLAADTPRLDVAPGQRRLRAAIALVDRVSVAVYLAEVALKMLAYGVLVPYRREEGPRRASWEERAEQEAAAEAKEAGGGEAEEGAGAGAGADAGAGAAKPRGLLRPYLAKPFNWLDLSLTVLALVDVAASHVAVDVVRPLRVLRVLRPLRLVHHVPELRVVVGTLAAALPGLFSCFVVALLAFLVFGASALELFRGRLGECTDARFHSAAACTRGAGAGAWEPALPNFDDFGNAVSALFQLATTDGSFVMLQEMRGATVVAPVFWVLYLLVGFFLLTNLFVGIVTDNFTSIRDQEMGFDQLTTPAQRKWLDMQRALFHVRPLPDARPKSELGRRARKWVQAPAFQRASLGVLLLHMAVASTRAAPRMRVPGTGHSVLENAPSRFQQARDLTEHSFPLLYLGELLFRVYALTPQRFFHSRWEVFDGACTVLGLLDWMAHLGHWSLPLMSSLRLLRIIRTVPQLKGLLQLLFDSIPALVNVGALLLLLFFMYAVLGVQLFGNLPLGAGLTKAANFGSFGPAMMLLVRLVTLDNWTQLLYACRNRKACVGVKTSCGGVWTSALYFYSFVIVAAFIVLQLFMAVVLEAYAREKPRSTALVSAADVDAFRAAWQRLDAEATGFIPLERLRHLLSLVPPPLGLKGPEKVRWHHVMALLAEVRIERVITSGCDHVFFGDVVYALVARAYGVAPQALSPLLQGTMRLALAKLRLRAAAMANSGTLVQSTLQAVRRHMRGALHIQKKRRHSKSHRKRPVQLKMQLSLQRKMAHGQLYNSTHALAASRLQAMVRGFLLRRHLQELLELQALQQIVARVHRQAQQLHTVLAERTAPHDASLQLMRTVNSVRNLSQTRKLSLSY